MHKVKPRKIGIDSVELLMVHPVYKTKTQRVKGTNEVEDVRVLDSEMYVRKVMELRDITSIEEYVEQGNRADDRSIIYDKNSGTFYAVKHSYEDLVEAKYGQTINQQPLGYASHLQERNQTISVPAAGQHKLDKRTSRHRNVQAKI